MLNKKIFADPPSCYRPIPFWFWNSRLRPEELERQISDFHDKGIGGFFIHGRFGLETDYLSREWLDLVKHAVKVADKLGMEVWLYDENGFPSGIGDLKVSRVWEFRPKFVELDDSGEYAIRTLEDPEDVVFGIDYLNPDAVKAFFDLTLHTYEEALGEHFGKTIKGIFTDEPTLLPWHHEINWYGQLKHTRVVVWNERIEAAMIQRLGMCAGEFLPHLFADVDEKSPVVRDNFWEVVTELYINAFFKPYSEWCEKRGLKLTGHVLFEEGLYLNTLFQADLPRVISYLDIPGTDHLGDVTEVAYGGFENTPRHLTNVQGQKLVSSIAHLTNKKTVISETYGCAGWGLSLERMKCIVDWQYSLGINMLCPHAMFYSIEGFRKWDAPPSHNHTTGWKFYKRFADYVARLSYLLTQGQHVSKIAVYYPLREFRKCYMVGSERQADRLISDTFDLCTSVLLQLHYDYDVVPESFLAQARVENGQLRIADESYSILIAPDSVLATNAGFVVREFELTGGTWIRPPAVTGDSKRGVVADYLESALKSSVIPDVCITSSQGQRLENIRYVHRKLNEAHVFFFANISDSPTDARICLEVTGGVEEWNAETGAIRECQNTTYENSRTVLHHWFPPYGSVVYVVNTTNHSTISNDRRRETSRKEIAVLPDEWQFEVEGLNAVHLKKLDLEMRPTGGGMLYSYSTTFHCTHIPDRLLLMLDDIEYRSSLMGDMNITVQVNETQWCNPKTNWYLDRAFKTLDIKDAICIGENTVTIIIRHSAWSGQPHLLTASPILMGNFACDPDAMSLLAPVRYAKAGSWTDFGYPFYSGAASYSQSFNLPEVRKDERVIVSVGGVRDFVEIVVNGKTANVRLWQPWEADITSLVRAGANHLTLKVTNSMANFFEASPRPSGLMGLVKLVSESNT
ncbi:MAG: glycosyl hydrolase [Armatimonadota bacterium]